jgi:hypothetical protein
MIPGNDLFSTSWGAHSLFVAGMFPRSGTPSVRQKLRQRFSASPYAFPMADFSFVNNPG